ncbi:MAG: hypothetical protein GY699_24010 [Desulfobacteraceae bacterium]|nr:hypothetical protein [Desulfobacteraceae bacterium]
MNEIDPYLTNINKISSVEPKGKQDKLPQKGDGSFDEILANQIDKGQSNEILKQSKTLPEIEDTFRTNRLNLALNKTQSTQKLTAALDMLETYAAWLGDSDKTLKQAYDLLEQVSVQTKTIAQDYKEDTTTATDLKQILNHLITTIEVEQIKFDRGDYS